MNGLFQCLSCGSRDVDANATANTCRSCAESYPVRAGVPLLLRNVSWRPSGFVLDDALGRAVCRAVGAEPTAANVVALREILAWNYDLPDLGLSAENNYFLERVRATLVAQGVALSEVVEAEGPRRTPVAGRVATTQDDGRAAFVGHYIPERLPPGTAVSYNVRLKNTGETTLSSNGRRPFMIAYHWRDADGRVLAWDGVRTALVVDVAPGRSLTLPILVKTPRHLGRAFLELTFVREGRRWLDEFAAVVPIELSPDAATGLPGDWRILNYGNTDYAQDHTLGRDMVLAELGKRHGPQRILEVGGCCHPQMEGCGVDVISVDIDVQTLQVGVLLPRRGTGSVRFVAADAADLPFADGAFDAAVMFSSLHHFPDPVRVLSRLRPLVKRDGFVAVMCEPCGHPRAPKLDPGYVRELEQGINEQCFSLEEYARVFDHAGLEAKEVVVHYSSLKALLRPSGGAPKDRLAPLLTPDVLPARPSGAPSRLRRLWSMLRRAG